MNFELKPLDLAGAAAEKCDALLVLVPQDFKAGKGTLAELIGQAIKAGDLETKPGKLLSLYKPAQAQANRVALVGAGSGSARDVRAAVLAGVGALKSPGLKKLLVCFAAPAREEAVRAVVMAVADASYSYTHTKSKPEPRTLAKVALAASNASEVGVTFERAASIVQGVELAKEWANRPANHATPTLLAQAAQELAKLPKISCEVLGPKEVTKLGMGAFLAVAQGSDQPLRFIVLKYSGAAKSLAPTVLVGKGITFDCGGISIKPAPEMDEMKFDMSGAASVLGTFRALAAIKPAINVVGLIPACENLINGQAVKPTAVVDVATLTGACVIALGGVRSGMYASQDALGNALAVAGETAQDLCWRMPLDDEYAEGLKTSFADVANVAGRAGGSITAAKFLQRFTEKYPWAHLDIAGTAWKSGAGKGATGRPVGLLVEYLVAQAYSK